MTLRDTTTCTNRWWEVICSCRHHVHHPLSTMHLGSVVFAVCMVRHLFVQKGVSTATPQEKRVSRGRLRGAFWCEKNGDHNHQDLAFAQHTACCTSRMAEVGSPRRRCVRASPRGSTKGCWDCLHQSSPPRQPLPLPMCEKVLRGVVLVQLGYGITPDRILPRTRKAAISP